MTVTDLRAFALRVLPTDHNPCGEGACSLATGVVLVLRLAATYSPVPENTATISSMTARTLAVCRKSAWVTSQTS